MSEVPAALADVIRKAVLAEINKKLVENRLYSYTVQALGENNGINAEMDKFIKTVYLFAQCKSDEVGQPVISTLPFILPAVCEAKVVTMASRQHNITAFLSSEETVWIADKTKLAASITSTVELWLHKNPQAQAKTSSNKSASFKRVVPRKVEPLFGPAHEPIKSNGAVPITSNVESTPQYDVNGLFIPRRSKAALNRKVNADNITETPKFKTKALRNKFGRFGGHSSTASSNAPAATAALAEEDLEPVVSRRAFSAVPPKNKKWIEEPAPQAVPDIPAPAPKTKSQKERKVMDKLQIVSNQDFQEDPLRYHHHQLYKTFAANPAPLGTPTRADFMGVLDSIELTTEEEYKRLQEQELCKDITFIWQDGVGSAMCSEHAIVRTAAALLEKQFIPGVDGHFAFNFDRYEVLRTFTDKDALGLFLDEHPTLAKLFDRAYERPTNPVGLGAIHGALKALNRDNAVAAIVEIINQRLTKRINFALKYELLADLIIEDFVTDFDELLSVMVDQTGLPAIATSMQGEVAGKDIPGNYIPASSANLVYDLPADVSKQWNQVINTTKKDIAARSLFLVERHCVCYVASNFNSNIAVSAVPNMWSEFRRDSALELWHIIEMLVNKQPAGEHLQVERYHVVFADGIVVEAKPTALSMKIEDEEDRVYLARIIDAHSY